MLSLSVAISDDGGVFNHWLAFLEDSTSPSTLVLQAMGSNARFRLEPVRDAHPRSDPDRRLLHLLHMADLDASMESVLAIAEMKVPIRKDVAGWDCQCFVMDLQGVLDGKGQIDGGDHGYVARKRGLRGRMEGMD